MNPHATRPLLPTTTSGVPGSVTPVTDWRSPSGGVDEPGAEPDVREPEPEVHVVGDDRAPGLGEAAGHGPVVRAPDVALRGGPAGARPPAFHLGLRGDRRRLERLALDGRVPAVAPGREEAGEGVGERLVEGLPAELEPEPALVLEVDPHGVGGEDRVLRPPRLGLLAEGEVLERARAERVTAGVHALGVGVEHAPLLRRERGDDGPGPGAEPVRAERRVRRPRGLAEEGRELAGRGPPGGGPSGTGAPGRGRTRAPGPRRPGSRL